MSVPYPFPKPPAPKPDPTARPSNGTMSLPMQQLEDYDTHFEMSFDLVASEIHSAPRCIDLNVGVLTELRPCMEGSEASMTYAKGKALDDEVLFSYND